MDKREALYKDVSSLEVVAYTTRDGDFEDGVTFILEKLDAIPVADVQPVRHGKWIVSAGGKVCTCPVCGDEFDNTCNYDIRKDWKCCPVCETKMG